MVVGPRLRFHAGIGQQLGASHGVTNSQAGGGLTTAAWKSELALQEPKPGRLKGTLALGSRVGPTWGCELRTFQAARCFLPGALPANKTSIEEAHMMEYSRLPEA